MRRVLITGGSGFIGSHLAEQLVAEGYEVRVFDSSPYPYPVPPGRFEAVAGELTTAEQAQEAVRGCDGVVHLAGVGGVRVAYANPLSCVAANVMGTANVMEAVRLSTSKPWIILASTREISQTTVASLEFSNLYTLTKFCAEECARRYAEDYGLRVLTMRFSDVYGSERDHPAKALPTFLRNALAGATLRIEDSQVRFDFIHYSDLVQGIFRGIGLVEACSDKMYECVTLCTGHSVNLEQLANIIVEQSRSSSTIVMEPQGAKGSSTGVIFNDPRQASELLGFQTEVTLQMGVESLRATVTEVPFA